VSEERAIQFRQAELDDAESIVEVKRAAISDTTGTYTSAQTEAWQPNDDAVASFDPLSDPVPKTFLGNEIAVYAPEPATVELRGERFSIPEGVSSVPEYAGVFAMARGHARKAGE